MEAQGGTNADPTPFELALMSLTGCATIIYADVCKKSKINIGQIEVAVRSRKNAGYIKVKGGTMKVNIVSKIRKRFVEAVWRRTETICPIVYIYNDFVSIKVDVDIKAE